MNILITGGAGYIGSHVVKQLLEETKDHVFVLDSLITGHQKTIDTLQKIRPFTFVKIDLQEFEKVNLFLQENQIDTILHFAAFIVVSESVTNPLKYYMNNTINTTNLIKCAIENGVKRFIFSSTAAVYGEPKNIPTEGINEESEKDPINPYGMSKLMSERVIQDVAKAHPNFKYVIFRYFNVAGASEDLSIGECHYPETHLLPLVAKTALGKREKIMIFGDDYDTPDGTNIRDYIHILDLANAHIQAIKYLQENNSDIFNCGYGKGYSVKEVIHAMKEVTCKDFMVEIASRRAGDPAVLIANNNKIKSKMHWEPKYENLEAICKSAYEWEKKIKKGRE
jgi:UDP-glucose 4-epimerase